MIELEIDFEDDRIYLRSISPLTDKIYISGIYYSGEHDVSSYLQSISLNECGWLSITISRYMKRYMIENNIQDYNICMGDFDYNGIRSRHLDLISDMWYLLHMRNSSFSGIREKYD